MKLFTARHTNKTTRSGALSAALVLILLAAMLSGCAGSAAAPEPTAPAAAEPAIPAESEIIVEPAEPEEPAAPGRQNGERFEAVITIEGMEEAVRYEHVRSEALGFEMDYDYERFQRYSEADRERFVSVWDEPGNPENYLEVTRSAEDALTVAAAVSETLSADYELSRDDSFPLAGVGSCIMIDASADVGGLTMPDHLQAVYIIPAADGCRVATAHYAIEGAEGFGRRFHYLMNSFSVIDAQGEARLTDEQALSAVQNYCYLCNPDLEDVVKAGEHPVYWEIESSDAREIVVLFRSYTGALIRYHIDPVSGAAYVTEFVPGVSSEETRTDENLNVWNYVN